MLRQGRGCRCLSPSLSLLFPVAGARWGWDTRRGCSRSAAVAAVPAWAGRDQGRCLGLQRGKGEWDRQNGQSGLGRFREYLGGDSENA